MASEAHEHHDMGVLLYRVDSIESTLTELKNSHKSIAQSLQQLVVLEQRHQDTREALERAFNTIGKIDIRLQVCEETNPKVERLEVASDRLHGAVWSLAIACIGAAFLFLWNNALTPKDPYPYPPTEQRGSAQK